MELQNNITTVDITYITGNLENYTITVQNFIGGATQVVFYPFPIAKVPKTVKPKVFIKT
jgi:hypothetical protein